MKTYRDNFCISAKIQYFGTLMRVYAASQIC